MTINKHIHNLKTLLTPLSPAKRMVKTLIYKNLPRRIYYLYIVIVV